MSHQSELIAENIHDYLKQHENKTLLRFITCGSVDDGKSTLIGRLLHDTKLIYEDQLAAIQRDSKKHNTSGEEVDLALLVDGLQSEREQGITIDVAYRYFSTDHRKYIIADTPGHEQYTRNMATGASTAQLAVILIDARYGVQTQTRRHSFICSLLGIRHLVIAVNKMDLMGFSQETFNSIQADYLHFAEQLNNRSQLDIQFIPMSALKGDNVVNASEQMPWYQGPTLMQLLDNLEITKDINLQDLRFPVQYVNRPNLDFRGYCGTLASGVLTVGDAVKVLPSGKTATIKQLVTWDGELQQAWPGQALTLTLNEEIDISRGDLITQPDSLVDTGQVLDAHLVWMSEQPLQVGKQYEFKVGTQTVSSYVTEIHHQIDVNTLQQHSADHLPLNAIGLCRIEVTAPVVIDSYDTRPATGGFIVIDRLSNATLAAGMIVRKADTGPYEFKQHDSKSEVVWNHTTITPALRATQKSQIPRCIWLTGLSGSGKSTLANALEQALYKQGYHTMLLDGDNVRHGLCKDLGMTDADRSENIRRVAEVARLMTEAGLLVITAFISPFRKDRDAARALFAEGEFIEVHVDAPLEVCEERDPKGLYKKARKGEIKDFTGVDSVYEKPEKPEVIVNTNEQSPEALVEIIIKAIR
ncbi:MAG: sulfate adenylyltransferase subunit CysN [Marinospirillum sp.]|uniref:sulfate adenylyltransferase subunit CysN n=1 Tax=Marinospirillum sp. TaxID=2183934 RepID=UPI0019DF3477|nr:sulfate adenylyltransferase subunit CysN [Marinospirillum sp.]MBE0505967.1 sulfate adenylyltransferase subunit CysN [Marinospirillum sp.]